MSKTLILASSRVQPYSAKAQVDIATLAAEAGAHGGFLAAPWPQGALATTAVAMAGQGLALRGTQIPLPPEPLVVGKRLPHWGSLDDAEERLCAVNFADQTLALAKDFGCTWAYLDAFSIKLKAPVQLFVQSFAENRWDRDRSSKVAARPLIEAALKERSQYDERLCDAARFTLERLAGVADKRGVTIAVGHGIGPWQFPSPREVDHLLEEFRGASLVKAHLPARLDILQTLGLLTEERRSTLALAPFVMATDAIGLRDDLAPGLGPRPLTTAFRNASGKNPDVVVVSGRSDTSGTELQSAIQRIEKLSSQ
jgi:hypothetical protein